jgi:hypothetical protein
MPILVRRAEVHSVIACSAFASLIAVLLLGCSSDEVVPFAAWS